MKGPFIVIITVLGEFVGGDNIGPAVREKRRL